VHARWRTDSLTRCLAVTPGARADLQPGEVRKIDNGFLVAWTASMNYEVSLATKSIVSSLLSGEAVVTTFTGPGANVGVWGSLALSLGRWRRRGALAGVLRQC